MSFVGWMNYHAHIDKGFLSPPFRYKDAPASTRAEWTREAKVLMTKNEIKEAAVKALTKMHQYGTVYVRTHVDVDPLFELRAIEALKEVQEEWKNRIVIDLIAFNQEGFDRYPETEVLLKEALNLGVQGIGGHTSMDQDGKQHIDKIIKLATNSDLDWIEFHTDETGRIDDFNLPYLAKVTTDEELGSKVTAIHCCSLANVEEKIAMETIEAVAHSGMTVTTCPTAIATRALTRVKDLANAGVKLQLGSDNLRDYFNPLGSGNMLQYGQLLAYILRFYEPTEMEKIIQWLSTVPEIARVNEQLQHLSYQPAYELKLPSELLAEAPTPTKLMEKMVR
ncbi:amidohydrolase family protein [Alkalihalobacillus hemicellulosilyticus]|uniref:Cytosine deaminase n=1 Tax=Halalkalibacter hemicellulosilyticusJCM 9152 TaxID=1236971 RepID=W4QCP3_9BACI|nr:amidohydrolase family protein [Halalkalibacter hemicellulosilyticus]GAE29826.1 cytosine deaminase [Halalkalibacter hemicellulosilyticusJCM 9152]